MLSQKHYLETGVKPPLAKQVFYTHEYHGQKLKDDYHWLKNKEDSDVLKYLKAENAYTEGVMVETKEMQTKLYKEMLARIKETDLSVPEKIDNYFYYLRTEEGKQYPIYCRKQVNSDVEQILLDENVLAEGHDFFSLGALSVSSDHKVLAFATNTSGDEVYKLQFKNLETGELLTDVISEIAANVEWANDNETYFFATLDETKRPYKIMRGRLGDKKHDEVYEEKDARFSAGVSKTRDKKFLLIAAESKNTSEWLYLDVENPEGEWKIFTKRREGIEYNLEHHDTGFYITTNDNAVNFKIMRAPSEKTPHADWREFVATNEDIMLDGVDCFKNHIAVYGKERGLPFIRIYDCLTKMWNTIDFKEAAYALSPSGNPEYETKELRYVYSSLVTPTSVYDYNMDDGTRVLKKQEEVKGGHRPEDYIMLRTVAPSHDGTLVPISLFYKNDLFKKDGTAPTLLVAYGSYGISYDPWFSSTRLSLANRGFVVAFASPRGGGELGRKWYYEGKFEKKKNTFADFIACAEYLIKEKYTSAEKLVISGGSAGGLLMGAVANLRPELFRVVVAHVPFVDVVNTMMDANLPLTVGEYEEWGNPNEKNFYDYMLSYSPYDNVKKQNYPHLFVSGSMNDVRVPYWESAKWVAKLRELKTDDNIILLKTHLGAGHAGPSGRYNHLRELAFEYAFILRALEV